MWRSSMLGMPLDCDVDYYLMVAKLHEKPLVSRIETQEFHGEVRDEDQQY
jgi:hypothetical protein